MAKISLKMFSGEVPKMASHLLNDAQAQATVNAKGDGGMLEAWYANSKVENSSVANPLSLYNRILQNPLLTCICIRLPAAPLRLKLLKRTDDRNRLPWMRRLSFRYFLFFRNLSFLNAPA